MWRASLLTALALLAQPLTASVFSEGGGSVGGDAVDYEPSRNDESLYDDELRAMYERRLAQEEEALAEQAAYEERMAEIISEMQRAPQDLPPNEQPEADSPVEEVLKQSNTVHPHEQKLEIQLENKETPVLETIQNTDKPLSAQKKGQSEFVSFVEPVESFQTRDIPTLEKRRLAQSVNSQTYSPKGDANLLMMAVGCVLVVGTVGGAIGGGMYYRRRRESPDDGEYAPYAATGPFKKSKKGDKGDESLAYKAQLHHYQQAKQKIICGDDAPGVGIESEEEEGADDENNFSVYECPGLAPTGDIEVHNPNFAHQP